MAKDGQVVVSTGRQFPELKPFDELMEGFVSDNELPGAALAVAKDGRLVYARGFGYADVEKKQPVQLESLFRIASISKPFTAVATLQLVEQGLCVSMEYSCVAIQFDLQLMRGSDCGMTPVACDLLRLRTQKY